MGGNSGVGPYEAELNRMRALEDWRIPKAASLQTALTSLDNALGTVLNSQAWTGSSAEAAHAALAILQTNFRTIEKFVGQLADTIEQANTYRRTIASTELPSSNVDPFWANAAKMGSVVVHPVLGPLAADKALDAISGFLGNQREEEAKRIVEGVERGLAPSARSLTKAASTLAEFDPRVAVPAPPEKPVGPGFEVDPPRGTYPGGGSSPGGRNPGSGGHYPDIPSYPSPDSPGGGGGSEPGGGGSNPGGGGSNPGGGGGGSNPGGGGGGTNPGGGGGSGSDDPSVDSPGGGVIPGGPGGGGTGPGSGNPLHPGGGLGTGGGGLGGAIGGGAGAAAIAASSKISGFGSMGSLGGASSAAGAGMRSGGGLLGNTSLGGTAGAGGAGSGGGSGAGSSGAAGAGARPGMGMMGGAGGGDDEKSKRNGLGGPIAPKIEDEDEVGPRSKGARAGSRDDHRKD